MKEVLILTITSLRDVAIAIINKIDFKVIILIMLVLGFLNYAEVVELFKALVGSLPKLGK